LVTELTVSIAGLERTFMARFSRLILILTVCFSATVAFEIVTGHSLIFKLADSPPGAPEDKVARATALGASYMMFVNVALYTNAVFLFRHFRTGHREVLPLLGGFVVYFASLTNDFNLIFGLYQGPVLQHFGFLALYVGFCMYHGLDYLRSVRELEAASLENQRYRDRLIEDERVRSLALVGAFVSHEINNLLQVVISSASLLERRLAASPSAGAVATLAHDLYEVSEQMSALAQGLRSLARGARSEPKALVPIGTIVEGALEICRYRETARNVALTNEIKNGGPLVECAPGQLTQVVINLVGNACDAVDGQPDAWVSVGARAEGSELVLSVTDSGRGVPPELHDKIMQPFFTTKPEGKGSGLGLALVSHIVSRHSGSVKLEKLSPNTQFVVTMPIPAEGNRRTSSRRVIRATGCERRKSARRPVRVVRRNAPDS
jgi:signal transduction histidine kinase